MQGHNVGHCLVYDHPATGGKDGVAMREGRDAFWSEAIPASSPQCDVEWVGSEDPLFLLYTSGSTG